MKMRKNNPMESNKETAEALLNYLIGINAVVLQGLNFEGEPVYLVTEKCKEVFPEFYRTHREELNNTAYDLWALGVIDIVFGDEGEEVIFNSTHVAKLEEVYEDLTVLQIEFLISIGAPVKFV